MKPWAIISLLLLLLAGIGFALYLGERRKQGDAGTGGAKLLDPLSMITPVYTIGYYRGGRGRSWHHGHDHHHDHDDDDDPPADPPADPPTT